jgi:hypothetical protein
MQRSEVGSAPKEPVRPNIKSEAGAKASSQ